MSNLSYYIEFRIVIRTIELFNEFFIQFFKPCCKKEHLK